MTAKVKVFANGLPSAPKPTKPKRAMTPSEKAQGEHLIRIKEYKMREMDKKRPRPILKPSRWSAEQNEELGRRWKEGQTYQQIADEMGFKKDIVEDHVCYLQRIGTLQRRRNMITDVQRNAVLSLKAFGLTHQQIADECGISLMSVNRILKKAREEKDEE